MESHQVHVRLGRRGAGDRIPLIVRLFPFNEPPIELDAWVQIPWRGPGFPDGDSAIAGQVSDALRSLIAKVQAGPSLHPQYLSRILLQIDPPDLVSLDWEWRLSLFAYPPIVTRFRPVSDMRCLEPFELPVGVLRVLQWRREGVPEPTESSMRYFRCHRVIGVDNENTPAVIRNAHCEIVHLVVDALELPGDIRRIYVAGPMLPEAPSLKVGALKRVLSACHARALILQCIQPLAYEPVLDFAQWIAAKGGPTTLVLQSATPLDLDNIYMNVVHDTPMYECLRSRAFKGAMFHGISGDAPFPLRPMAESLLRETVRTGSAGTQLLNLLPPRALRPRFGIPGAEKSELGAASLLPNLKADLDANLAASKRAYDYAHESGAWEPLPLDSQIHARAAKGVTELQRSIGRVVNVGFKRGDEKLSATQSLEPGSRCILSVQIGRRADWSQIDGDAAFPEQAIERLYSKDGVELRVVVFAPSFEVTEADRQLHLDRPPAESAELRFAMTCPRDKGWHRVRVCIYKDLNLLQSVLARVHVGGRADLGRGVASIDIGVEFALTSTLQDVNQLPARQINFLSNEKEDGTHTFAIAAAGFTKTFDFGDSEMRGAVDAARDALYNIAADTSQKTPAYRFNATTNATNPVRFAQDLIQLAELGAELYTKIVTGENRAFAKALEKALGVSGATIQISSAKSARYVFPWALVYDHQLVSGALSLCPQFAADLAKVATRPLSAQTCLANGCPNRNNTSVVCPSGFWGFKHNIEQPFSVETAPSANGERTIILQIEGGPPGADISALMIVSRELSQVGYHQAEIRVPGSFNYEVKDTKAEAAACLQDPARAAHLVYFYCHGGRDGTRTWLGIGRPAEKLRPADLTGLGIDWTGTHPLIFINGCHTADFTTDDLLNFNQVLSYCGAAGVVGTEIKVPESLARFFAKGFLLQFRQGIKVGRALREQRLSLLGLCNVLGLAYTPYCSVDLQLIQH